MGEYHSILEVWNMKWALKLSKFFLFLILALIISTVAYEYSRIQDTQMAMTMFTRIAGNYALTSAQDVDSLTSGSRDTSKMYKVDEYNNYLTALHDYAYGSDTGDSAMQYIYSILHQARIKASRDGNVVNGYFTQLDYTPLSFNIPYLSKGMFVECYDEAMKTMVTHYTTRGLPSICLASFSNSGNGLKDNNGNVIKNNCIVEIDGQIIDMNDMSTCIPFKFAALDAVTIRQIYGSETYYDDVIEDVLNNLNPDLYIDLRSQIKQAGSNHTIMYNLTVTTPYYYITGSSLFKLKRTSDGDAPFIGLSDDSYGSLYNSNGVSIMNEDVTGSIYNNTNPYYSNSTDHTINTRDVLSGRVMLYMGTSNDGSGTFFKPATATFSYTFTA